MLTANEIISTQPMTTEFMFEYNFKKIKGNKEDLEKALHACYEREVNVILGDSDETIEAINKDRRIAMDAFSPGICIQDAYMALGVPAEYFKENEE
tara:strand:+ start:171 stop:458 length:288 start_codon:yes stop_codon:yes gene_type:complete